MDEEERLAEKVGMAAPATNGLGDPDDGPVGPDGPAGMGEGVVRLAADWAAGGRAGGVAEWEDALLAPCIISSAISVTGSFKGTFGADSVSWRYNENLILRHFILSEN